MLSKADRLRVEKVVLFTNVRDEKNMYEWVAHHLLLGFDAIYIYDHKSIIPLQGQFDNFNKDGEKVFVSRCELDGPIKCKLITRAVEIAKSINADWMLYLDADEFFVINSDKINNVKQLLSLYTEADSVSFNWLMFGSNGHEKEPDGFIIDNYTKCQLKLCDHIKSFLRPSQFTIPNPHKCAIKDERRSFHGSKKIIPNVVVVFDNPIEYYKSIAYFAHYYVQSKETWLRRKLTLPRDDDGNLRDKTLTILNTPIFDDYNMHNDYCDVQNLSITQKYSENIKNYLRSIGLFDK
jgi:hypothetical protein